MSAKFVAKVGFVREMKFESHRFVRPAFCDQITRHSTAERTGPFPRCLLKLFREMPLQLPERHPTKCGHLRGLKARLKRHALPLVDFSEAAFHNAGRS